MTQTKAFATRLDPKLIRALKIQAAERGLLLQTAVAQALRQWLKSDPNDRSGTEN